MKKVKENILDEIYYSFREEGTHFICRYGLDLGVHSKEFDVTKTSGNLDFRIETYQTRFENVYFNIYLYDYNTNEEYDIGYFYFKANNGRINKEMMMFMADILEKGNEITERIFEEVV